MKTLIKLLSILCFLLCNQMIVAQKSIKDYVTKNSNEKIKKSIVTPGKPATHKSFKDGHGINPYFSSTKQLPDTIALVTFHINDVDALRKISGVYEDLQKVSSKGGSSLANKIQIQTIASLKEAFKKRGSVLLTPEEYLDTEEKREFYYNAFSPEVSKLGRALTNLENKATNISVCADFYRFFDLRAALDYKRSASLGGELTDKLGVDGLLSIAVELETNKKGGNLRLVKMAIHGPNPNPKVDKKYFGQKNGTGYNDGQLYFGGTLSFKKPIKILDVSNKKLENLNIDGVEVIFSNFIEKFYDTMDTAIKKVSK